MELIKNVAAIVGCVISCITLITLIIKPFRVGLISFIKDKAGKSETDANLAEIRIMLKDHIDEDRKFRSGMEHSMALMSDFAEKECRYKIKAIFDANKNACVLSIYDKKMLLDMEDLYIKKMHKNHWGQTLIAEMKTWSIDYTGENTGIAEDIE